MIKREHFTAVLKDESGATAIEYGLIAALVSVAAILALQAMGTSLDTMFTSVSGTLNNAIPTTGTSGSTGTSGTTTGTITQ